MLYKFKSKAAGDLIMLEPQGRRVLQAMGKDPASPGIVVAQELAGALAALKAAIALEESQQQAAAAQAKTAGEAAPHVEPIGLRQRAWPMVEMLERCVREKEALTWGV